MILIIDGGGSSTRGYVVDGEHIISTTVQDQGNIAVNYASAFVDYRLVLEKALSQFKIPRTFVFAAGFAEVDDETKNRFIEDVKAVASKYSCKEIMVASDADLPLYMAKGNVAAITLGTGTAFVVRINDKVETLFGFGHLISDPFSGYALSRRLTFEVLTHGTDEEKNALFGLFGVSDYKTLIRSVYTNPSKKYIASIWKEAEKTILLQVYFRRAIAKESEEFFQPSIVELLQQADTIILNGSVALSNYYRKELYKHIDGRARIIPLDDEFKKIQLVAQSIK